MLNKVEKLFRKSHTSRQATKTGLDASATVAASGTAESKENSGPALRNAAQVVKKLDEVIAAIGTTDGEFPVDQNFMQRLLDNAEKLPYKLPPAGPDWSCDEETKSCVMLAVAASEAAYGKISMDRSSLQKRIGLEHHAEELCSASYDGSIKQLSIHIYSAVQPPEMETGSEKTLIVAIRGSVSFVDWITNFNGCPVESEFVVGYTYQCACRDADVISLNQIKTL
ncbi:hypothetical protein LTR17_001850 [Elasticomyces elasticus]|nr:hypothetical protein LTR17_001850 [Elasticomyces elasticus]